MPDPTSPCTCPSCRERLRAYAAYCASPLGEAKRVYFEEVTPRWQATCPALHKEESRFATIGGM